MTLQDILNLVLDGGVPGVLLLMWWLERKERVAAQQHLYKQSEATLRALAIFRDVYDTKKEDSGEATNDERSHAGPAADRERSLFG
jgi:hypothetical protein